MCVRLRAVSAHGMPRLCHKTLVAELLNLLHARALPDQEVRVRVLSDIGLASDELASQLQVELLEPQADELLHDNGVVELGTASRQCFKRQVDDRADDAGRDVWQQLVPVRAVMSTVRHLADVPRGVANNYKTHALTRRTDTSVHAINQHAHIVRRRMKQHHGASLRCAVFTFAAQAELPELSHIFAMQLPTMTCRLAVCLG